MTIHWISRPRLLEYALSCIQPNDLCILSGDALRFTLLNPEQTHFSADFKAPICLTEDCQNASIQPPQHWPRWTDQELVRAITSHQGGLIQW